MATAKKNPTTENLPKEVTALLNKDGHISERDLANIDLLSLEEDILDRLFSKVNAAEKPKTSNPKAAHSIYREANAALIEEGVTSVNQLKKAAFFKKERQKIRKQFQAWASIEKPTKEQKAEFKKWADEKFTAPDFNNPATMMGGSISKINQAAYLLCLKRMK